MSSRQEWSARSGRTSSWITKKRRWAIYDRDGWRCVYCWKPAVRLTLDHLRPRLLGGSHDSRNLVTACQSCNSRRQSMPLATFCRELAPTLTPPWDWRKLHQFVRNASRRKVKL